MAKIKDPNVLGDLKKVNADTFTIHMIEVSKIRPHPENFYEMSEIPELADDIERQGLKNNLTVQRNSDDTYTLIAGHRRLEAVKLLSAENRINITRVPCIINAEKSADEQMLDLIMLNATTRELTDGDKFKQWECVREIYENKKARGEKIDGRIRDKIADALNESSSQVSKYENISKNASVAVQEAVKNDELSVSTANELAKLDDNEQEAIINDKGKNISHKEVKELVKQKKIVPHMAQFIESDTDEEAEQENVPYVAQNLGEEIWATTLESIDESEENSEEIEPLSYEITITKAEAEALIKHLEFTKDLINDVSELETLQSFIQYLKRRTYDYIL